MGLEDEAEQTNGRPYRQTNGRSKRTCELIHRPARVIVPPRGARVSPYRV
jgi:hypothetical protein